jgi:hypothetical protein
MRCCAVYTSVCHLVYSVYLQAFCLLLLPSSLAVALLLCTALHLLQLALMTSKERQATVTTTDKVTLLTLDRKTFKRILGELLLLLLS